MLVSVIASAVNDVNAARGALLAHSSKQLQAQPQPDSGDAAAERALDDAVCEVRGSVRGVSRGIVRVQSIVPGSSEVEKLLRNVRRYLGWAEVPVLRNRTPKVLGYFETPFDDFGPVPPPTMDYAGMRADALSDDLQ